MSVERITIDPAICHGKPCVRGLRYPVEMILELLSAGMDPQEILTDYEDLEYKDILKDSDFVDSLIVQGVPHKLLRVGDGEYP